MSVTHVFKVVDGLSLEIDVLSPTTKDENTPVILHFHGGFLVHDNISKRVVIAGSSAGGYLALAATAHPATPKPLALLSIYGMMDSAGERYIHPGQPLGALLEDEAQVLKEVEDAMRADAIDGYAFPMDPPADSRFRWIMALHQAAQFPDVLTRKPGLGARIAGEGLGAILEEDRVLFPVRFGLKEGFPPTVLLHGDADDVVGFEQSVAVAEGLKAVGVDVSLERAEGQGHGFEVQDVIDLDGDEALGDKDVIDPLRRVIVHLERHVQ
ncbi:Alpha/beta hydrolase fold-3 [Penicillium cf. griseofulvum]|nr:Alpha/beta hydrolase fold-3 [Penicillium cf. griseofulvum]